MIAVLDDDRAISDHAGPWTEADYLALPSGGPRIELVDGSLLVSPAPSGLHQRVCRRLANALETCSPDEVEVLEGVNLRTGPGRLLIPDVLVTFETAEQIFEAGSALIVVEVLSPSNTGIHWQEKHALYAAGRIPWFLIAETGVGGKPALTLLRLDDDAYVEHAKAAQGEVLSIPIDGFHCSIDPADLVKRRP